MYIVALLRLSCLILLLVLLLVVAPLVSGLSLLLVPPSQSYLPERLPAVPLMLLALYISPRRAVCVTPSLLSFGRSSYTTDRVYTLAQQLLAKVSADMHHQCLLSDRSAP